MRCITFTQMHVMCTYKRCIYSSRLTTVELNKNAHDVNRTNDSGIILKNGVWYETFI